MQYHFVSREEFERLRDQEKGFFVETAEFGGNLYGTSVGAVEEVSRGGGKDVMPGQPGKAEGKCCVLDIEMEVSSRAQHIRSYLNLHYYRQGGPYWRKA